MDERILNAILRFGLDKASLEQVKQGEKSVVDGLKEVQKQAEASQKKYAAWQQQADKLGQIGMKLGATGMVIGAPLVAAMASYVNAAGKSEQSSRQWLAAQDRIAASTERIGKVALEGVLPVIEQVAGLTEKAAAFAEKNPDAVKGILGVSAALVGVGSLMSVASQGMKLVFGVQEMAAIATQFAAAKLMKEAADEQLGAAAAGKGGGLSGVLASLTKVLGPVLSVAGGVMVGDAAYNASGLKQAQGGLSAEQIWTGAGGVVQAGWAGIIGGRKAMDESLAATEQRMRELGGVADDTAGQLNGATGGLRISSEQMLSLSKSYMQYQQQEVEALNRLNQEKAQTVKDYQQKDLELEKKFQADSAAAEKNYLQARKQAEANYQAESSRALRDYATQGKQSEEDYYLNRKNAARDFSTQVARAEEDFQRSQSRKREDFNLQVEDYVGAGDARGYEKAKQAYELDRQRSQEDYAVKGGRDTQDFNTQQGDNEAQFQKEQERRSQEFAIQQADRAAQFAQERTDKQKEYEQQTQDRTAQLSKEREQANKDFTTRMSELDTQFQTEKTNRHNQILQLFQDELGLINWKHDAEMNGLKEMIKQVTEAMPAGSTTKTNGSRASGGYVNAGMWRMHNNEFVLNAQTTRAAEVAAGRRLDQQAILNTMGRGGSVTWLDQRRFDSRLSAEDRRQISQDNIDMLSDALNN
jgi:hypothetical protein